MGSKRKRERKGRKFSCERIVTNEESEGVQTTLGDGVLLIVGIAR